MKYLLGLITWLLVAISSLFSQSINSLLVINKDSGTPVPYAIISNIDQTQGGYANEAGFFDFELAKFVAGDSLLISAIGYFDFKVEKKSLSPIDTVRLEPSDVSLSEVVVKASYPADKNSDKWLGVNQKRHNTSLSKCSNHFGSEYAVKMVKDKIEDEVDQVYIYLRKSSANDAPFRVKIYGNQNGLPFELLHSVIVKPTKKLKKWNSIGLKKRDITQGEKIFYVAFEWLETKEKKYTHNGTSKRPCFGQKLGLSKSVKLESFVKYWASGDWRNMHRGNFRYTPMIKVKMK